jgi:hypothetical protein
MLNTNKVTQFKITSIALYANLIPVNCILCPLLIH